jgi:drug/metabolite transporter (DMT)-like permease
MDPCAAMQMRLMPFVFVVLWSSGFIFSKLAMPHAEPFTFLALRFGLVALILLVIALAWRVPWPAARDARHAVIAGSLLHALYLGPVFWAIAHGMPAGVSALIVSMQPLLTAILAAWLLGERIGLRHGLGVAFGVAGVVLVLAPKIMTGSTDTQVSTIVACLIGLAAITAGNLYQKRFATGLDLRTGGFWQFLGAAIVCLAGMLAFERGHIDPQPALIVAMLGSIFILSLGAIPLLMLMIRTRAMSSVAAYFFLVPPVTALMAYALFDEQLVPIQFLGMALACLAVALVTWRPLGKPLAKPLVEQP